jgi:predicted N-acetyltransferase YhbS
VTATGQDGPRPASADELEDLLELIERVFRTSMGMGPTMELEFPLLFSPANTGNLVIVREGKGGPVVSHAGLLLQRVVIGDAELPVGCIGAVCTDPAHRGRGLAGACVEACIELARRSGCLLALISGTGGIYERAGAAPVVPVRRYHVDRYKLGDPADFHGVIRLATQADIEPLAELHRGDSPRYDWRADDLSRLLNAGRQLGLQRWVAQRDERLAAALMIRPAPPVAMSRFNVATFVQFVGDASCFAPLTARALDALRPKTMLIRVVPGDHRLDAKLEQYDRPAAVRPRFAALVLDLPGLLAAMGHQLRDDQLRLAADGAELQVESVGRFTRIDRPLQINAALFNGASHWPRPIRDLGRPARAALARVLPIALPDYGLNYV